MSDPAQPVIQHAGDSVTTGTIPVITDEPLGRTPAGAPRPVREPVQLWLAVLAIASVALGALGGAVWRLVVELPTYRVSADGGAVTTERALTEFIAADAWFVAIGLLCGIALGLVIWFWFGGLGWPAVLIALALASVMALTCWQIGWLLGPGPLEPRLAAAKPGEVLPIEFTLRSWAALVVWPLAATIPLMVLAALTSDPEETPGR